MTLTPRMRLEMPQTMNSREDHPGFVVAHKQDEQQLVMLNFFEKSQS